LTKTQNLFEAIKNIAGKR